MSLPRFDGTDSSHRLHLDVVLLLDEGSVETNVVTDDESWLPITSARPVRLTRPRLQRNHVAQPHTIIICEVPNQPWAAPGVPAGKLQLQFTDSHFGIVKSRPGTRSKSKSLCGGASQPLHNLSQRGDNVETCSSPLRNCSNHSKCYFAKVVDQGVTKEQLMFVESAPTTREICAWYVWRTCTETQNCKEALHI